MPGWQQLSQTATIIAGVGDGTADDTLAVRAAITAAGVGGVIAAVPGKTYLTSGSLDLLQGQTFWAYGAKVKRCNAVTTTTTASISTGTSSTNIAVSSSAGFAVGMDVAVWQSSSVYDTSTHRVTAIPDATHITVGTAFTQALNTGSTVTTAFPCIYGSTNADTRVLGLEIDGNRANNTGIAKWYWHNGIALFGARSVVRDCYVHDEVSEGIYLGGVASAALNNTLINLGGNGIHFSGTTDAKAIGNYVYNATILGSATDHADGCIIFSNSTGDSLIADNYCDTAISGVASIDSDDNSSVAISGNIIRNMTTTAIEGIFPASTLGGKVTITGNLIYSSVKIALTYAGSFSTSFGPYNWIISNNYFYQTLITLTKGFNISVTGNQFDCTGDTTNVVIAPNAMQNVVIANNQIKGGAIAVYTAGSSNTQAISVTGNLFQNQSQKAVYIDATHSGNAVSVTNNTVIIESTFTPASGFIGIYATSANTFVSGNSMALNGTFSGSSYGILGSTSNSASVTGAIITNNWIRSAGLTAAIKFLSSTQGNIAAYNFTQQAVTDSGTNTLTGNVTVF